jgi:hypothetical protein
MQALVIFGLCQICAIGRILHDTQGVKAIRVRGEMLGREVRVTPHHARAFPSTHLLQGE